MKLAQITNPAIPKLQNESGVSFFQQILPRFVGLALIIGLLIFFFVIIVGAIGWITSGGDKAALESARGKIANAITGLVVLLVLFALVSVIENFFGIKILSLDIGSLVVQ